MLFHRSAACFTTYLVHTVCIDSVAEQSRAFPDRVGSQYSIEMAAGVEQACCKLRSLPCTPTMSAFPDYYSILGVQKAASSEEVRQAYRKESLK